MPTPEPYPTARSGQRWRVRVRQRGHSGQRSITFDTEAAADKFCRTVDARGVEEAIELEMADRGATDEMTLDEWAVIHFESLTEASAGTIKRYRKIYDECWSPPLGHMRLSKIERSHVARALNQVTGADKTVRNKWAVLTDMFKKAVLDGKLERTPTLSVKPGRKTDHETEEHRYLTHGEFKAILHATPEYWRPLILMLAGTGMRWGELAALTVADIDTDAGTVRITKAVKQDPEHPTRTIVGPTKTKKSRRTIALPADVLDAINPLLDRKGSARLFLPPKSSELRHRTFYRDIWQRKCLGLDGRSKSKIEPTVKAPYPRLHDLRHTHVAWLIAAGVSLPVIQARLGHEKIATTIDTYGHLLPDLQKQAADAAQVVLTEAKVSHLELD